MLEWRNLWTLFRLPLSPILPVIARVSAILCSANACTVRNLTKSREF